MAHAEEPSPFGSYDAAPLPDDAIPHETAGGQDECVASVLESPFVSAQVDDDEFQHMEKKERSKDTKVQEKASNQPQTQGSTASTMTTSSVCAATSLPSKGDMNNAPSAGVADMLESPFVSACLSQDLRDVAETLANASAAAEQLASATAAVNIAT